MTFKSTQLKICPALARGTSKKRMCLLSRKCPSSRQTVPISEEAPWGLGPDSAQNLHGYGPIRTHPTRALSPTHPCNSPVVHRTEFYALFWYALLPTIQKLCSTVFALKCACMKEKYRCSLLLLYM